jgi:hypothetical protein
LLGHCCAFSAIIVAVMAWRRLLDLTRRMIDDVPILTKKLIVSAILLLEQAQLDSQVSEYLV